MASFDPVPTVTGTCSICIATENTLPLPDNLEQHPYKNLVHRIERESESVYPAHGGGYADVYTGYFTDDNKRRIKVAIKVLRVNNDPRSVEEVRRGLNREAWVWHRLKHPNILEFLGLASDHGRLNCPALISPYCDNQMLGKYLSKHPDTDRMFMIKGVAVGLEYLHKMKIVHGDLKPSNILVDDHGNPLLCDFGRSRIINQRGFTMRPAGACRYQAVELLHADTATSGPTRASDMCAFGLSCYEVWTGLQPFHGITNDTSLTIKRVLHNARPDYPNPARPGTERLWPILKQCWDSKPSKRPTATGVVQALDAHNQLLRVLRRCKAWMFARGARLGQSQGIERDYTIRRRKHLQEAKETMMRATT